MGGDILLSLTRINGNLLRGTDIIIKLNKFHISPSHRAWFCKVTLPMDSYRAFFRAIYTTFASMHVVSPLTKLNDNMHGKIYFEC